MVSSTSHTSILRCTLSVHSSLYHSSIFLFRLRRRRWNTRNSSFWLRVRRWTRNTSRHAPLRGTRREVASFRPLRGRCGLRPLSASLKPVSVLTDFYRGTNIFYVSITVAELKKAPSLLRGGRFCYGCLCFWCLIEVFRPGGCCRQLLHQPR